ncbi:MAG: pyruvate kinase [Deltaproteobacteria bacterium]
MDNYKNKIKSVFEHLISIKDTLLSYEERLLPHISYLHPSNQVNAKNLIHYLTLRTIDIRNLQDELHSLGLSSLSISESHIMGQINAILRVLDKKISINDNLCTYEYSKTSVNNKIHGLFGPKMSDSQRHIMVTIDSKWIDNIEKFESLLKAGMNIARINCAHDEKKVWKRLIENIKKASHNTGISCKIHMDLAGPKLRTITINEEDLPISIGGKIILGNLRDLKKMKKKNVVACNIESLANQLKPGEQVYFDDGIIKAIVSDIRNNLIFLEIKSIASKKQRIKNEKGINFPDSYLSFSSLTEFDEECIPFISQHADLIGYSFVKDISDIAELRKRFFGKKMPSIILKIETAQAVYNLPSMLIECMKEEFFGVMIARGDLALEIGFERLSEIQEEILWICEAAHTPVIWATQVLENLNKKGLATRSEITDAARSSGADCVMLNKGEHIVKTVKTLKNIFNRMGNHQYKKRFIFRPLSIAQRFLEEEIND